MFNMNQDGKKKLKEIIEEVKTCMFTTTDENCNVFSRPMLTIKIDNELNLWFFSTEHAHNINIPTQNKQATLVFSHPGKNTYMSVYGSFSLVRDTQKINELWTPALKSWFAKGIEDPALYLVQVTVDEAVHWDNATNEMIPLLKAESHKSYQTAKAA